MEAKVSSKGRTMKSWQIDEAEGRLADIVQMACSEDPQELRMDGRSVTVVLSREEFDHLTHGSVPLSEFMRRSPLYGLDELELTRPAGLTRTTEE